VQQITYPQPASICFVGIAWPYSTFGGSNERIGELSLSQAIDSLMEVKQKVGPVRDQDPSCTRNIIGFKAFDFFKEAGQVDHNPIANDTASSFRIPDGIRCSANFFPSEL
jgi:hypothetical protein